MAKVGATVRMGTFLFSLIFASLVLSACEDPEKKMDEIEKAGHVEYYGQRYQVGKVDREHEVVYIVEPDGVQIPAPLDTVKPVE